LDGNQTLQIIAPDLDHALRAQILHGQAQIYESKYLHTVKAFRGVRDVFETLPGAAASLRLRPIAKDRSSNITCRCWASMSLSEQRHAAMMSNMGSRIHISWVSRSGSSA
jgi:hypothetical protein